MNDDFGEVMVFLEDTLKKLVVDLGTMTIETRHCAENADLQGSLLIKLFLIIVKKIKEYFEYAQN